MPEEDEKNTFIQYCALSKLRMEMKYLELCLLNEIFQCCLGHETRVRSGGLISHAVVSCHLTLIN